MRSLYLFRRDLRIEDNTALNAALLSGNPVTTAFIVDPYLLKKWSGAERRLAFLFQSLVELARALQQHGCELVVRVGEPAEIVSALITQGEYSRVFVNRDYSPSSQRRDRAIETVCTAAGATFHSLDDLVLNPPAAVMKADGTPYTVFTPYFRRASTLPVAGTTSLRSGTFYNPGSQSIDQFPEVAPYLNIDPVSFEPGVSGANRALDRIASLGQYDVMRDIPAMEQTSRLSAHLRFGTCSSRQVYDQVGSTLGTDHPLIRQLYWRDFYFQIAVHFPHVFRHAFRRQYDAIQWSSDDHAFELWRAGRTGFPIVDAGMRELQATGFMHNRVRMVVASFLTKNLHIDWRRGETHFADLLVDYEPAVNNGNWQWGASTGCDAQPYFRVFNPWRQQQRFDKDCVYIKRWVPELAPFPPAAIHKLEKTGDFYLPKMVDLRASSDHIKAAFKSIAQAV